MCGIIGYTGHRAAAPILLDGLSRLEYRGYDSAGIAVMGPDEQPHQAITPNVADMLGAGWEQISNNVMGEFLIRTYLEEHLPNSTAADAAAGWGGDSYSLLSGPGAERLLLMQIRWDTFEDSGEFFQAYRDFWTAKIAVMPEEVRANLKADSVGETGMRWVTPNQTTFVGQQGPVILRW